MSKSRIVLLNLVGHFLTRLSFLPVNHGNNPRIYFFAVFIKIQFMYSGGVGFCGNGLDSLAAKGLVRIRIWKSVNCENVNKEDETQGRGEGYLNYFYIYFFCFVTQH